MLLAASAGSTASRSGVPRLMLLMTDGKQNGVFGGDRQAISTASAVKQAGVMVVSVGFGGVDPFAVGHSWWLVHQQGQDAEAESR